MPSRLNAQRIETVASSGSSGLTAGRDTIYLHRRRGHSDQGAVSRPMSARDAVGGKNAPMPCVGLFGGSRWHRVDATARGRAGAANALRPSLWPPIIRREHIWNHRAASRPFRSCHDQCSCCGSGGFGTALGAEGQSDSRVTGGALPPTIRTCRAGCGFGVGGGVAEPIDFGRMAFALKSGAGHAPEKSLPNGGTAAGGLDGHRRPAWARRRQRWYRRPARCGD